MKIRLDRTKIVGADGKPLALHHVTDRPQGVDAYLPLSHFGTEKAAAIHARGLLEKAAGRPLPLEAPDPRKPVDFRAYMHEPNLPPLSQQKVFLHIRSPLAVPDLSLHSVAQWKRWFENIYVPKKRFLSRDELHEAWALKPHETRYKKALAAFIFDDPAVGRPDEREAELAAGKIFTPGQIAAIRGRPDAAPSGRGRLSASDALTYQRLIRFLTGEGYDGFSYRNAYEDKGSTSYMIMRPAQVFQALDDAAEHSVPQPGAFDGQLLAEIEKRFFDAAGQAGPTARIAAHAVLMDGRKKAAHM